MSSQEKEDPVLSQIVGVTVELFVLFSSKLLLFTFQQRDFEHVVYKLPEKELYLDGKIRLHTTKSAQLH